MTNLLIILSLFFALMPGESVSYGVLGRVYTLEYTRADEAGCMFQLTKFGGGVIFPERGIPKGESLRESVLLPKLTCQENTGLLIAESYIKDAAAFVWLPVGMR